MKVEQTPGYRDGSELEGVKGDPEERRADINKAIIWAKPSMQNRVILIMPSLQKGLGHGL